MKINIFIEREDGLIKKMKSSYETTIVDWEKIPNADDLDKMTGETLTNAMALVSEFEAFMKGLGEYAPENLMTYKQKRQQPLSENGYGTPTEQLEMMNEQGFTAWQAHCAEVKTRFPK